MFGYVTIDKPELKIKDYRRYQAFYCGLCLALKERSGLLGRLTLTYDMTFLVVLLTSLYECDTSLTRSRCALHPAKKHDFLRNEVTRYAADMNILLSYYHLQDDWQDEKSLTGLACSLALKQQAKLLLGLYPAQADAITSSLEQLSRYEEQGETDIDKVAGCFGKLMEGLFLYRKDQWEPALSRMGFFLGKFVYLMDAFDDLPKDLKSGGYNPLIALSGQDGYEEQCLRLLTMMIAECCAEFEKLPVISDAELLRNILYSGVWTRYRKKQDNRS